MRNEVGIYSLLLATSLGLALWASSPKPESSSGDDRVAVVSPLLDAIEEIRYEDKSLKVTATRQDGDRFWIEQSKLDKSASKAGAPDEASDDDEADLSGASAQVDGGPKAAGATERFLASKKITDVTERVAPLMALRALGTADSLKLEDFGLVEPEITYSIRVRGRNEPYVFRLGKKAFGKSDFYAKFEGDGKVYLLDGKPFLDLKRAKANLYERDLLSGKTDDIRGATIVAQDKTKVLRHTNRDEDGDLKWTDDRPDATVKAAYDTWMGRIERLRVNSYATADDLPKIEAASTFLEIRMSRDGDGEVLQFRKTVAPNPEKPGTDLTHYWIHSTYLSTWVSIGTSRGEAIEKDLSSIFSDS